MRFVWVTAFALVLGLGCGGPRAPHGGVAEASAGPRPETPSRDDVVRAMGSLHDAVRACGGGRSGEVSVRFVFGSSGAVTDASINGVYVWGGRAPGPGCDPTPDSNGIYDCRRTRAPVPEVDSCILRVVRAARVPPFTRPSFGVNYPFRY